VNRFQKESYKFLFFLFFLVVITYAFYIIRMYPYIKPLIFLRKCLDMITITVPPTLPIAMTVGVIYAIEKLKAKEIYTISPNQIVEGGVLDTMCFDKTGTLTTDHMDFRTLHLSLNASFQEPHDIAEYRLPAEAPEHLRRALINMASNHTVVRLEETGELVGDPMEIELLNFSQFEMEAETDNPAILFNVAAKDLRGAVCHRYDFDSTLQRMSVVCKLDNGKTYLLAKGSPEIMLSIMKGETVPEDYRARLREYASSGFRVLAIASREVGNSWKEEGRETLEATLEFNGFEVFENRLKPETRPAIEELREVSIETIMITGDNPITASNIGYQSGILDPETHTLIIDHNGAHFQEDKFAYSLHDLPHLETEREHFWRQSEKGRDCHSEELRYADELVEKAQTHNYNLCFTGKAFHRLFSEWLKDKAKPVHPVMQDLLEASQIYSRTKPDDKANVVAMYQRIGRAVGYCGDGANDCAALSKANLGLSLSETEASVGAAFTAKRKHIGSMVELIKESRAGLATNFSLFNIMACYALTQYAMGIIDEFNFAYPAQFEWIYQDMGLNFLFVMLLGNIGTVDRLTKQKPTNSLFSFPNILKLVVFHVVQLATQVLVIVAARGPYAESLHYQQTSSFQKNYQLYLANGQSGFLYHTTENNALFLVANFFLLGSEIAFLITKPWKKEFYTYLPFSIPFACAFTYTILIVVYPPARPLLFRLYAVDSPSFCRFLLALGLGVGILLTIFLQKCLLDPLFRYADELKEEQKKEDRRLKHLL
jgi:cation-transporting P-type ATPase 13A2